MSQARLILGSGSPRRLDLLRQINIEPDIIARPDILEIPNKGEKPRDYVIRLAREKNQALADKYPNDFVITGDTTVALGRRFIEKAKNDQEQRKFMNMMSGRAHRVLSAVCLKSPHGKISCKLSTTRIIFKRLSHQEIEDYVQSGHWQGKAGYGVQDIEHLIQSLQGSYSGAIGLPLYETHQLLTGMGYYTS